MVRTRGARASGSSPERLVAPRRGRKPYEHRQKVRLEDRLQHQLRRHLHHPVPAPSECPAAACFPSAFGMYRRNTALGRYVPARSSVPISSSETLDSVAARPPRASGHPPPPRPCSASPASTPPTGRHSGGCGRTARGSDDPATAWPPAHSRRWSCRTLSAGSGPRGYLGRASGHALALTSSSGTTTPGTLPSGRVLRHGHHGTTIPSDSRCAAPDFRLRLIRATLPRRRPRRRVSPVPHRSLLTCCSPYPGGDPPRVLLRNAARGRGLRRDMSGSAPALFI